jgi:hypothetical protein
MYDKHILNISGKQSVAFMGAEIAMASNRDTNEKTEVEWDAVRVYRIDPDWAAQQEKKNGKKILPFTLGFQKGTLWLGDRNRFKVFYANNIPQVLDIVRSHLPEFHRGIRSNSGSTILHQGTGT